jgi:porphobilinogen synthase
MYSNFGDFPRVRLRRNRRDAWSRRLVQEHSLTASDLVWPVFVQEGTNAATPIASMRDVSRLSVDLLIEELKKAVDLGIPAVAIFPVVEASLKDDVATEALNPENLICRVLPEIKAKVPDIGIICDVALDPYTAHGHDGLIVGGQVANDETVEKLVQQAILQAKAGCDIVAPSDMMDGRVGAIRDGLDAAGFGHVRIMSYAAKYASSFYGPFREAVGSAKALGLSDKKSYQMDPANADEALREVALDIKEGADMVLVKPGMPYLDILSRIKHTFSVPVFAYQVSGEYAMIKTAAENDLFDADAAMYESLIAFKRAGATGIFTYAALEMAKKIGV